MKIFFRLLEISIRFQNTLKANILSLILFSNLRGGAQWRARLLRLIRVGWHMVTDLCRLICDIQRGQSDEVHEEVRAYFSKSTLIRQLNKMYAYNEHF